MNRQRGRAAQRSDDSGRNEQVVRVLRLLDLLARPGGVDLYELAERHGASVRTIRRDLAALRQAGILVQEGSGGDGPRKRWTVHDAERQRLAQVRSAGRALAVAQAPRPSGAWAELDDVAVRLTTALGQGGQQLLARLDACFVSEDAALWSDVAPALVRPLVAAIAEQRLCRVRYAWSGHDGEGRWVVLLPLQVRAQRGQSFLLAWLPEDMVSATFRLRRIEALEPLELAHDAPPRERARRPEELSLSEFSWEARVAFRLRFSPAAAPAVRQRVWHPAQELSELRGGAVELRFEGPTTANVAAWLASWGQDVEVLAPARLRASFRALGGWLVETYR